MNKKTENKKMENKKPEHKKYHKYGWKPDHLDQRDKQFKKIMKPVKKMPVSVDLRKYCSTIEDQGDLGSCTANAVVGNLEFLEIKNKVSFEDLSRLFVYYQERVIENTVNYDSGAELRDGIKALVRWGDCSEMLWKYDISKFTEKPSLKCYDEALKHKILSYYRISTIYEMRNCLASEYPFVFGFSVYESFESEKVATTGIVPMPKSNEQLLGGHAVLAVGYDDSKQSFLVRNSWGANWGIKGYFWIPYKYLNNRNLSEDFWTIRKEEGY